jgi:hypothetical protein
MRSNAIERSVGCLTIREELTAANVDKYGQSLMLPDASVGIGMTNSEPDAGTNVMM